MGLASFYNEKLLPRMIDKLCGFDEITEWRRRAVAGLSGTVLELGFGSGLNVPLYPPQVTRVLAVEPSSVARKLAAERIAQSPVDVEFVGIDGQRIPLADESVDNALSTFTLCTIPDEHAALREVFRILRPGGQLHIIEHGLAPDDVVVRRQRRVEPIQRRLAGGCHLTRDHWAAVRASGFETVDATTEYARGLRIQSFFYVGVARKPAVKPQPASR